jgi:hypothetical protein
MNASEMIWFGRVSPLVASGVCAVLVYRLAPLNQKRDLFNAAVFYKGFTPLE